MLILLDGITTSTHIHPSKLELPIVYQMAAPLDSRGNTKITDRNGLPVDLWLISANAAPVLRSHAQVLSAGDWQLINCRKKNLRAGLGDRLAGLPTVCAKLAGSLETLPGSLEVWQDGIRQTLYRAWSHNIYFSLTHSGTLSAIALSRACSVGIDVETAAPDLCVDLMEDYLSPAERNFVRHLPRGLREREFLRLWDAQRSIREIDGLGPQHEPKRNRRIVRRRRQSFRLRRMWAAKHPSYISYSQSGLNRRRMAFLGG